MDFVPLLVMTALVKKGVDFVKYVANRDVNAVVTQIVAWGMGIALAFIAANSAWAESILINGIPLSVLSGWSLAFVGVNIASLAGFGWDTIKALDGSNSAVIPDLLPPVVTTARTVPPARTLPPEPPVVQ
jgi:hypothetical protein